MFTRLLPSATCVFVLSCTCTEKHMIPEVTAVRAPEGMGRRAFTHVAELVAYGPRHTGSPGWGKALRYIEKQLRDLQLEPVVDDWMDGVEGLTFTNISVTLPGTSPDKIVIGCHHDTKKCEGHPDPAHNFYFVGANDSGSGVGLLLELARVLKDQKHQATYELVFFDGEESLPWAWDPKRALFGSRRYVRRYKQGRIDDPASPKIHAFILLDMVGATDLQIDEETNSDKVLRDIFFAAAKATGHERYFFANSLPITDDHIPFLSEGIPAIDLIDLEDNPHWHKPDDSLAHVSADSLHLVGEVVLSALPAVETWFFRETGH